MANPMQRRTISADSYLASIPFTIGNSKINSNNNNNNGNNAFLHNHQVVYGIGYQLDSMYNNNADPAISRIPNIVSGNASTLISDSLKNDAFQRSCDRTLLRRAALVAPITRQYNSRLRLNLSKVLAINLDEPQPYSNDSPTLPNGLLAYPESTDSSNSACSSESDSFDDEPTVATPPSSSHVSRWNKEEDNAFVWNVDAAPWVPAPSMDSSTATQISSNINDLVRKPALVDMQSSTAQMPVKLAHHAGRRRQRSKYNKADRVGEQGGMATLTDSYKSSPVNKAVLAKRANCQNEHNTTKRSLVVSSVMPGRSLHCNPRYSFNGPSAISAFSVMSWNILSQQYTARSRFNYVPSALLDWQHRSTRIIQMIVSSRAAIVALQEVDETFYHDVLEPQLREHNYLGIYERKRHPTLTDGCAIFYQQYRFSLIDVNVLHYQEAKINDIATSSSRTSRACPLTANQFSVQQRDLACRFNMHHNLALIATFHDRWTDRSTRIVNTHLLADPMYADAKLLQAALLCEQLERQMERDPMNRTPSTVLCGDWNSLPNSDVMTYLLAGRISRHAFGGSNFGRFTRNRMLRHRLHLTCAYATVGAKMNATVRTPQFTGEVDRILYTSSESLRVLAVLGDVNKRQQTFLPNASVPSDHMPLLTVFAYLSGRTTTTTILPAQSNVENVGKSTTLTASTPPLLNTAKACHLSTMLSYYPAHGLSSVYNGIQGNSNGVMASSSLSDNLAGQAEQLDTSLQMKPRATRRYRGTRGKRGGKRVARANAKNKEATTELGNQTSTVSTTT